MLWKSLTRVLFTLKRLSSKNTCAWKSNHLIRIISKYLHLSSVYSMILTGLQSTTNKQISYEVPQDKRIIFYYRLVLIGNINLHIVISTMNKTNQLYNKIHLLNINCYLYHNNSGWVTCLENRKNAFSRRWQVDSFIVQFW